MKKALIPVSLQENGGATKKRTERLLFTIQLFCGDILQIFSSIHTSTRLHIRDIARLNRPKNSLLQMWGAVYIKSTPASIE